ncbi:MAG: metallophosphoesterase, partial [Oscillospiraceae bacterium]|nr:metallophosphoesterase [Oscillospiraceae bacterium]
MKLLAISDAADPGLWDYFSKEKLEGVDAILACGDLPSNYLSFLVTMGNIPVFYVHGNHDATYEQHPPEGCECIDGRMVEFRGYRILGLGGCSRYNKGPHQSTEREMGLRIAKVFPALRHGGLSILLPHAPALG